VAVAGGHLVGREEELRALDGLLEAIDALPRAAVLSGEAGIGKTTLWLAASKAAEARGYRVLASRPSEAEARFSFAALADLLGGVLAQVLPELPGPQRRALEAALALSDAGDSGADERVVAFGFLSALRLLGGESPLLLAIDDLQWVDAPTLALLRFALPRLEGTQVAVVLTVRGDVPPWLRRALPDERLLTLELRSMSMGALHELLRTRLGAALPRPTLRRIFESSGGNPFFALELARALQRRGGRLGPGEELPLPADLDQLLRERLDGLTAPGGEVARVVAAVAEPTVILVEAAVGRRAETGVTDALESRILELDGERLRFTHPLLGSAIGSRSNPAQRRALHARLSVVVPDPEERTRHLALAAAGPDPAVAAALDEAAQRARARGAPAASAELAEHALRLTPPGDDEDVRRRRIDAADHVCAAGDNARAIVLLETALGGAPLGPARAAILRRLAAVHTEAVGPRGGVALYRDALAEAGDDHALAAGIELELADTLRFIDGWRAAEPHARAARAAAERDSNEELLSQALAMFGLVEFKLGRGIQGDVMRRAVTLEESLGLPPRPLTAKESLCGQLLWSHDLDRARALADELRDAFLRRDDTHESEPLWYLALIEWRAGNWSLAADHADAAQRLEEQSGRIGLWPVGRWPATIIAVHRGLIEEARTRAEEAIARAEAAGIRPAVSGHRWILGFIELSRGDPGAALEHLRAAYELREAVGILEPCHQVELPDLLEALVAVGALEEAEAVLGPWEERARRLDRSWALAIAARTRALLRAARGDPAGALTTFGTALTEHERAPDPFQEARTLLALGATQRPAKARGAARTTLERAQTIFEQLPAPLWAEKVRGGLARIGGRAPSRGELTSSERRIADLVADGRTNREVAAALFVTEHTVEAALTRVYGKLGLRSRAELAGRLRDKS
jgi:DNA-binding CsgD family transcriptional regulator